MWIKEHNYMVHDSAYSRLSRSPRCRTSYNITAQIVRYIYFRMKCYRRSPTNVWNKCEEFYPCWQTLHPAVFENINYIFACDRGSGRLFQLHCQALLRVMLTNNGGIWRSCWKLASLDSIRLAVESFIITRKACSLQCATYHQLIAGAFSTIYVTTRSAMVLPVNNSKFIMASLTFFHIRRILPTFTNYSSCKFFGITGGGTYLKLVSNTGPLFDIRLQCCDRCHNISPLCKCFNRTRNWIGLFEYCTPCWFQQQLNKSIST